MRMECNKRTTPIVAYIHDEEFPFHGMSDQKDNELISIAKEICEGNLISSVYLIGEGFSEEWMKDSLRYLCKGRRVFQGNNLYSKGACYCLKEKHLGSDVGQEFVFLGNEKLKANIGLRVFRRGDESYYALLDAGINWFEAQFTGEFYLQDSKELELVITPLNGKNVKVISVPLEELPIDKCEMTRIKIQSSLIQ